MQKYNRRQWKGVYEDIYSEMKSLLFDIDRDVEFQMNNDFDVGFESQP